MSPAKDDAWKRYENEIVDLVRARAGADATVTPNASLPGRLSGVPRQIDILVKGSFSGVADALMVIDCKCYGRKVDVKDVEAFLGMLEDVGSHLGMLITTKGFSAGAQRRAMNVVQEVVPMIDVVLLSETGLTGDESKWWMFRATEAGKYRGDYHDHEPYGPFLWLVVFVTGGDDGDGTFDEEEMDTLWMSDAGGWDGRDQGMRMLATVLARHCLGRNPSTVELQNLTQALEREVDPGQGFEISTYDVATWIEWGHEDAEE